LFNVIVSTSPIGNETFLRTVISMSISFDRSYSSLTHEFNDNKEIGRKRAAIQILATFID